MIRIVVRTDDAGPMIHLGVATETTFKTFDLEAPALEGFLSGPLPTNIVRQVVGVEFIPPVTMSTASVDEDQK